MENVRHIPEWLLAAVQAKVEKINRKALKFGIPGFVLSARHYEKPSEKRSERERGITYPFVEVKIEGPKIEVPGGWSLEGRVDFEDGLTIVNARPGTELPVSYREATQFCDHCQSMRRRNSVFVFSLDGKYMQVGRQCLRDYLGHDPERVLWAASEFGSIFSDADENAGGSWGDPNISVALVLEAAAFVVRKHGFVSRKMADERDLQGGNPLPTSSGRVLDYLFPGPASYGYEPPKYEPLPEALIVAVILSTSAAASCSCSMVWPDSLRLPVNAHAATRAH